MKTFVLVQQMDNLWETSVGAEDNGVVCPTLY